CHADVWTKPRRSCLPVKYEFESSCRHRARIRPSIEQQSSPTIGVGIGGVFSNATGHIHIAHELPGAVEKANRLVLAQETIREESQQFQKRQLSDAVECVQELVEAILFL